MTKITWTGGSKGIKYTKNYYLYDPDVISYQLALDNLENGNASILSESLLSDGKMSIAVDSFRLDYEYGNFRSYGSTLSYGDTYVYVEKYGRPYSAGTLYGAASTTLSGDVIGYFTKSEATDYITGVKSVISGSFDYSKMGDTLYDGYLYYVSGNETFRATNFADEIDAGPGNDVIYGNGGNDILDGESGSDIINGGDGSDIIRGGAGGDSITPGKGNDDIDGGSGVDEVWFSGKSSDYHFSGSSSYLTVKDIGSGSNDGTDTLKNIENLRFTDRLLTTSQSLTLPKTTSTSTPTTTNSSSSASSNYSSSSIDSLTGLTINSIYRLDWIRDYDGNSHGYLGNAPVDVITGYKFQGWAHTSSSIYKEAVFTNKFSGRWATVEDFDDNKIDYLNYGKGGGTRIVGIYQDPLVAAGIVQKDSVFDGSRTFINDLKLDNLVLKYSGDFDGDGFQEIYWSKVDNTAYLRAVMHADGNIQYANYQNLSQMTNYLTGNGNADIIAEIV
tara:strand:+ start:173 stop:1675 length:1503 start_codon:yes stop_codon:yes gene_type:complete